MSLLVAAAAALLVTAPSAEEGRVDAAFDEVSAREDSAAIERIEPVGGHPARLLNLGVAYARQGNVARARQLFHRAAMNEDMLTLETADGAWVDSRVLARRALADLSSGKFAAPLRTARR